MCTRVFLGLNALLWLPYGLYCLLDPGFLAEAAGVAASSTTGTIELRAMYGGLQAAVGALAALAVLRASWVRPALAMLAFLCAGLFLGRALGAGLGGELSLYTTLALGFELLCALLAAALLARQPQPFPH